MKDSVSDRPRPQRRRRRRRRADRGRTREHRGRPGSRGQAAAARSADAPRGWRNPNWLMPVSATVLIVGVALVGLGPSTLGAGLTLLGATAFFYSIHKYGRLGPDRRAGRG